MYHFLRSLVDPVTMSFVLMGMALAWAWWKHPDARRGLRMITLAFVLAWIGSTKVVAYFSARLLERGYVPVLEMPDDAEAIVLLSGGAIAPTDALPETRPTCNTLRRCREAARLYHSRPVPVIACGGKVRDDREGDTLAMLMQSLLVEMGVEQDDILLEETSRNTHQNAVEAKRILDQQNWSRAVVVTDTTHLPRAERCFQKVEADTIPAGAYYAASHPPRRVSDFFPSSDGAKTTSVVLHELLGMGWYKLRGRI